MDGWMDGWMDGLLPITASLDDANADIISGATVSGCLHSGANANQCKLVQVCESMVDE